MHRYYLAIYEILWVLPGEKNGYIWHLIFSLVFPFKEITVAKIPYYNSTLVQWLHDIASDMLIALQNDISIHPIWFSNQERKFILHKVVE